MNMNNNKHIDLWETGGRFSLNLALYAVIALVFADILRRDIPTGRLMTIGGIIAGICIAIAAVCFYIYNRKHKHDKKD